MISEPTGPTEPTVTVIARDALPPRRRQRLRARSPWLLLTPTHALQRRSTPPEPDRRARRSRSRRPATPLRPPPRAG